MNYDIEKVLQNSTTPSEELVTSASGLEQRAEELLTNERFFEIKRSFENLEAGHAIIGLIQLEVLNQGNKLREELGLKPKDLDGLTCAGFMAEEADYDEKYDVEGNPIVLSYAVDEDGAKIGHTNGSTSGNFVANDMGLRTMLLGFCSLEDDKI